MFPMVPAPILLTTPEPTTMAGLLDNLSTIATTVFTWVGNVATKIVSTPILLLTTGFLVVGGAIGIFGRLLSKR